MSHVGGQKRAAPFVTGSIMRHVVVMTLTGAVGLMALFMVDLVDLFFLSLLNDTEVTAAIGYAGTIVFSNLSVSIGCGIAAAALVARNVGAGDQERARQFATVRPPLQSTFGKALPRARTRPEPARATGASPPRPPNEQIPPEAATRTTKILHSTS